MEGNKPVWGKERCAMCLRCLHRCPKFAIQYGKSTGSIAIRKSRQNPDISVPVYCSFSLFAMLTESPCCSSCSRGIFMEQQPGMSSCEVSHSIFPSTCQNPRRPSGIVCCQSTHTGAGSRTFREYRSQRRAVIFVLQDTAAILFFPSLQCDLNTFLPRVL